jgi:hypothetical protein
MGLFESIKSRYAGFIVKKIEKKYEGVMKPVYLPKPDIWVVDTKYQQEQRMSPEVAAFNKKMKGGGIPTGAVSGDLLWVMGEFSNTGLFYRFWTMSSREDGHPEHAHSFEGVLSFLADDPNNFEITESFKEDYSEQELAFIKAIQKRYAELDSKKP